MSCVFFVKQRTAYEMRISDWSSDVCSSDLVAPVKDIHCYVRTDPGAGGGEDGFDLRTRMFAPLDGVPEDPATGSANCALAGLLVEIDGPADGTTTFRIAQGVEMGRPSLLLAEADRTAGVPTAIRIEIGRAH